MQWLTMISTSGTSKVEFFLHPSFFKMAIIWRRKKRCLPLGQPFPQRLFCPINYLMESLALAQVAMSDRIYGLLPKATWANNMS